MDILKKCLDRLIAEGADKAEVNLVQGKKEELNIHSGEINLLRSMEEYNLELTAIIDQKKDTIRINKIDDQAIGEAVAEVIENARKSEKDTANDVPDGIVNKHFADQKTGVDIAHMHFRLKEFIGDVRKHYEYVVVEEAILDHVDSNRFYENSSGVSLSSTSDQYNFVVMFFAKKGKQTSSFNYTGQSAKDLKHPLLEVGSLKILLKEAIEHLEPQVIPEKKFTSQVIVTPDCLCEIFSFLLAHLSNQYLISGVSQFKDKIGEQVVDTKLTLKTEPHSAELAVKNYFGSDGFIQRNDHIIQDGILKNYLLNYYGALKTGYARGPSTGSNLVVEPGVESFSDMIKSTEKGIILSRFSGGMPAPNGEFSGIAKNSYYLEDGEIKYPIKETMISGNIFNLFNNILGISKERINNGESLMPYIKFDQALVSSK